MKKSKKRRAAKTSTKDKKVAALSSKGRPSKYKSSYCQELIKFFDVEPYDDVELEHYDKEGNIKWKDKKRMANRLPTLRNFAKHIKVHFSTVYYWIEKHKEFSDAFTHAQELRKWFLIENGLNGCYNPLFAKFVAVNITDMKDKSEQEHSGIVTFALAVHKALHEK